MDERSPPWPLGPLEERIVTAIWRRGPSSVRQVLEDLLRERRIAYTTVMTVMSRLTEKGVLRRAASGAWYVYSTVLGEEEYATRVSQRLARDLVSRFGDLALAQFAAELDRVSPERLQRLRQLAAEEPEP
jgi:predicted transcriptional regulator